MTYTENNDMWVQFGCLMVMVVGVYMFIFSFVTITPPGV